MKKPDATGSKNCVLYVRVSSKEQEKEGFSIPAQVKLLKEYAQTNGLELVREFADIETAKMSGREGFNKMQEFLKKNTSCRIVLVEKTDRLYCNFKDYVTLEGLNIELHLVKEGTILSDDSRSSEKFIHGIKVLMAKNYIDNLSEEASKGMRQKAEEGMWPSVAPIGYRNVEGPEGKKIVVVDSQTAPLIKWLFNEYSMGIYSVKEITRKATEQGLVFRKSKKAIPITTVHKLLTNRMYAGEFEWCGKIYQGKYEPLITKELWLRVQEVLGVRNAYKTRKTVNGFTYAGLVKCGHCGCSLVGEKKKKKYIYYHCTGFRGKCVEPYTREEALEAQLVENLKKISLNDEVLEWMKIALKRSHVDESKFQSETVNRLTAELQKITKRLNTLYEDRVDERIDEAFYDEKAKGYRLKQEKLITDLKRYQRASNGYMDKGIELLDLAHTAHTDFYTQKPEEKRRLLATFMDRGTWKGGVLEPAFKQPFDMLALSNSETSIKKPSEVGSEGFLAKWLPIPNDLRTINFQVIRSF